MEQYLKERYGPKGRGARGEYEIMMMIIKFQMKYLNKVYYLMLNHPIFGQLNVEWVKKNKQLYYLYEKIFSFRK